jgi:multicomponent Na+:H+ antiporter subunit F
MFEDILVSVILPILSLTMVGIFYRLWVGPSLPDRVVALDLLSTLGIALIAIVAMASDIAVLMDVATVIALTGFLGTVAFAYFIEQRG